MTILSLFVGLFLSSITISAATAVLSSIDSEDSVYRQQRTLFMRYMQSKSVKSELLGRISEYFLFFQDSSVKKILELPALPPLPVGMNVELHIQLYRALLRNCPVFDYKQFTMEVVLDFIYELKPSVFVPNQHIVNENEKNYTLYIISSGLADVWTNVDDPEKRMWLSRLKANDFFGERSLLDRYTKSGDGRARATVKSVTYCNMLTLEVERFAAVLKSHGHGAQQVTEALKRFGDHVEERTRVGMCGIQLQRCASAVSPCSRSLGLSRDSERGSENNGVRPSEMGKPTTPALARVAEGSSEALDDAGAASGTEATATADHTPCRRIFKRSWQKGSGKLSMELSAKENEQVSGRPPLPATQLPAPLSSSQSHGEADASNSTPHSLYEI